MKSPMGDGAFLGDRDQSPAKPAPYAGAGDKAAAPVVQGVTPTRGWWVAGGQGASGQEEGVQEEPSRGLPAGCCHTLPAQNRFWQRNFRPGTEITIFILVLFHF